MLTDCFSTEKVTKILGKVSTKSVEDHYNAYTLFDWPSGIPDDQFWMPAELMTIHGTSAARELTTEERMRLSKWESINFYSLNIHGIRELLVEVCRRIHTDHFAAPSEFFHHFIEEENSHLWLFARFCLRYGGKIYPERRMPSTGDHPAVHQFMIFAKILIFEEIVDFFNVRIANDTALHPLIRDINGLHHRDESRHIACSRELVSALHENLRSAASPEELGRIEDYLRQYMVVCVESLYNPQVYKDAGLHLNGYELRRELLAAESRKGAHRDMLKRTVSFFFNHKMFASESMPL